MARTTTGREALDRVPGRVPSSVIDETRPSRPDRSLEPGPERHPEAVGDAWEWQLQGSCRGADSELFFHPYGEREPSRSRRERSALAICSSCPVLIQCRRYALDAREPYGVWGGLTETDRQEVLAGRRAPLGPRRYEVA